MLNESLQYLDPRPEGRLRRSDLRIGQPHHRHSPVADYRTSACSGPRCRIVGAGPAECWRTGREDHFPASPVLVASTGSRGTWSWAVGRNSGRPGSEPRAVDESGARILAAGERPPGYANGSRAGLDRLRSGQQGYGTGSRLSLRRGGRGKEENGRENRKGHRAGAAGIRYGSVGCNRRDGRPAARKTAPCNSYFHGSQNFSQCGNAGVGRSVGARPGVSAPWRSLGDDCVSFAGRPQSQTGVQGNGAIGTGARADQARGQAHG